MSQIRPAKFDMSGADAASFEQAALPSVVACDAFIFWYGFLSEFAGIECEALRYG